ncbi:hypothetical protein ES702_01480 [subsurface metagenome]
MTERSRCQVDVVAGNGNAFPRRPRMVQYLSSSIQSEQPRIEARGSMALRSEIWGMLAVRYHPARRCIVFVESGLVVTGGHSAQRMRGTLLRAMEDKEDMIDRCGPMQG